jgi:hypothetical protein
MNSSVKFRLERSLDRIPEDIVDSLRVPYYTTVKLKRPIGLHVVEGADKGVYVKEIKPDLGAARSKRVEVGDQVKQFIHRRLSFYNHLSYVRLDSRCVLI